MELLEDGKDGGCVEMMRLWVGLRRLVEHFISRFTATTGSTSVMPRSLTSERGSGLLVSIQ